MHKNNSSFIDFMNKSKYKSIDLCLNKFKILTIKWIALQDQLI